MALEVEVCILKGEKADQGVATDRGRNLLLIEIGVIPADVPDQGAELVSEEPVLHRGRGSSLGLPAGGLF